MYEEVIIRKAGEEVSPDELGSADFVMIGDEVVKNRDGNVGRLLVDGQTQKRTDGYAIAVIFHVHYRLVSHGTLNEPPTAGRYQDDTITVAATDVESAVAAVRRHFKETHANYSSPTRLWFTSVERVESLNMYVTPQLDDATNPLICNGTP